MLNTVEVYFFIKQSNVIIFMKNIKIMGVME